ncbi:MAG: peptide chain release factor N(5)-glutamine methyltransferase [Candidatus Omnitrophica bacterium]|nr:peptide chain release factor N(5)-glutamine methyltransferase [Candidatus Omnitrophota bacterium]
MISLEEKPKIDCLQVIKKAQRKIARLDAEVILAWLLGIARAELYVYQQEINREILQRFDMFVRRRADGEPLQYIIGKTEFMGLEFIVTKEVFIPRPETELLVEKTIEIARTFTRPVILDIGTGCGNIAIALTKFIADCKIKSSEVSKEALCIANTNAQLNGVDKNIEFILSDLFENLPDIRYNIIVSNPPYVASSEIGRLAKEISFEPPIALDGGADGLDFYRRLLREARRFLSNRGFLILEVGFGQRNGVEMLLQKYNFHNILFYPDYNNIMRIAIAQWNPL